MYDFLCAFFIFAILLASISVISDKAFFENAFLWDGKSRTLSLFGFKTTVSRKVPYVIDTLLSFNNLLFGKGFSSLIKQLSSGLLDFAGQLITVIMEMLKSITGAN